MLRAHFLGGADEVGASCVLVEAAGLRVMIDAGLRMGSGATDRLPHLARVDELGGVDAVVVTHAHLDHSGALPVVHAAHPRAPVLATAPTLSLLRVLLLDAIKVMEAKADQEEELPLYPRPAVEALLARATGVPFLEPVPLRDGAARVTFYPAGHVLGAAAVGLETDEGTVLVTGDLSITDQITVPGMARPRIRPDLLVCESTYGGRLHGSRRAEEERLVSAVFETLEAGGSVLVPAFALGRAQEVLLLLRKALARPDAPRAAVYADGMVRAVCGVYSQHPEALAPALRDRALAGRSVFFTADGRVRPVSSPEERAALLDGGPTVVVASSGMLAGGPSVQYAERLAGREGALIAITGYQDEEAPGRQLQEVAAGRGTTLRLGPSTVEVRCRVGTFGLSAHADSAELAALVEALRPAEVALVHGDGPARQALARELSDRGLRSVHLPAAGESVEAGRGRVWSRPRRAGLGGGRPLDAGAVEELRSRLALADGALSRRPYSAYDLAEEWHGSGAVPADLGPLRELLDGSPHLVEPDRKRPFLYRFADPDKAPPAPPDPLRDDSGRLEQNAALAVVDELLGPGSGLYKRGVDRRRWRIRLCFDFPAVATRRHEGVFDEIAARTGWGIEVSPEPNTAALSDAALEALPAGAVATRRPSVRPMEKRVAVVLDRPLEPEAAAGAAARFEERTGLALEISVAAGTPQARCQYDEAGRMEVNAAFAEVDRAFAGQPHRPYRKSKRGAPGEETMELAFLSPEVGERYRELIAELAYRTSWRIAVADKVEQQTLLRIARELLPETWAVTKGPGIDLEGRRVRVRLAAPPAEEDLASVRAALLEATGFDLEAQ